MAGMTPTPEPRGAGAAAGAAALLAAAIVAAPIAVQAQDQGEAEDRPGRELSIAPAFEGWERNDDGSFNLVFGYMNRSWDPAEIPIGLDNRIEPGAPDRGQPTRFQPRRNRHVFRVRVPADFGDQELVWTLTSRGETERAYATLHPDYFLDDVAIMNNNGAGGPAGGAYNIFGNQRPELEVEGLPLRRTTVGEPVVLRARATDDGVPRTRNMPAPRIGTTRVGAGTPNSASGLRVAWIVYRGPGAVTFDPPQFKVWEDYRAGADSPWAPGWKTPEPPEDGTWAVEATFYRPGRYVIRALAHDGGLATHRDVTVTVGP